MQCVVLFTFRTITLINKPFSVIISYIIICLPAGTMRQSKTFEITTTLESSLRVQQTEPAVSCVHCAALCMKSLTPHTAAYNQGQGMCQCLVEDDCGAGDQPSVEDGWQFLQLQ